MVSRPLHFPEDTFFSCTDCGKCCTTPWRIRVDRPKADLIRTTDIYTQLTGEGYHPLKVMDEEFELARREDGRCYFLKNDLCGIHSEKGASAKPSVCQLYPFSLVATPDGYFVSLAFTCPAVISGCGAPADSHSESLKQTVQQAPHFFPPDLEPGSEVTLTSRSTTDWTEYLKLEATILSFLKKSEHLVDGLLRVASAVMTNSWQDDLSQSCRLRDNLQEMLPLFLANSVASMEEKAHPEKRAEYAQCLLYGGKVHSHILNQAAPPYQPGIISSHLTRSILKRYVASKIWGKSLITGPTLVIRLLMLALSVEILLYYYEAKKALDGVLHFDPDLLEWSFDLIETDFLVHHELVLPLMGEWERVGLELASAK